MMQEDAGLPFLLAVAGLAGNRQPRTKGNHYFLHIHLLFHIPLHFKTGQTMLSLLGHFVFQDAELDLLGQVHQRIDEAVQTVPAILVLHMKAIIFIRPLDSVNALPECLIAFY